jgi:hypothetical protein
MRALHGSTNITGVALAATEPVDMQKELARLRAENEALKHTNVRMVKQKAAEDDSLPIMNDYDTSLFNSFDDIAEALVVVGISKEADVMDARCFARLFDLEPQAQFKENNAKRGRGQFLFLQPEVQAAIRKVMEIRNG